MSTVTQLRPSHDKAQRALRRVAAAAISIPVLILGQFAMLAIIPVAVVVTITWRHKHMRPLRAWATGLATLYAIPLTLWAIGPDRAPSLSKDMAPPFAGLIVAGAIAFVGRQLSLRGRTTPMQTRT
jgi:hypothetical protein